MLIADGGSASASPPPPPPPPPPPNFNDHLPAPTATQPAGNLAAVNTQGGANNTPAEDIQNGANAHVPPPPPVTVDTPVTKAVKPVVDQAAQDKTNAEQRLATGQQNINTTQGQLDDLYQQMDVGLSTGLIEREKRLKAQLAQQQRDVAAAQGDLDKANATIAAGNVARHSEQAAADQQTATASSGQANKAFQAFTATNPQGVTLKQGEVLTDQQVAALTPQQKAAYESYIRAQTTAANDQAKLNADIAVINQNLAVLQQLQQTSGHTVTVEDGDTLTSIAQKNGVPLNVLLGGNTQFDPSKADGVITGAGDPDLINKGDQIRVTAAMTGIAAVNDALEPLGLVIVAPPPAANAAEAQQNLANANQDLTFYSAVWNATSSAVTGFDATLGVSQAQQRVIALEKQIKDYEAQHGICLAPNHDLMRQLAAAKGDVGRAQEAAKPFTIDYNLKAGFVQTLQTSENVAQVEGEVRAAQAVFDEWRRQNPNLAAPGNPLELTLVDASRRLTLAREQDAAAKAGFLTAYGDHYAYQADRDAEIAYKAMNGGRNICIANPDPTAMAAWKDARSRATAAHQAADGFRVESDRLGANFQVNLGQHNIDTLRQNLSTLESQNGDPAEISRVRGQLTQAEQQLQSARETKGQADYNVEIYKFEQSLPENLRNPQTDEDKAEAQRRRYEFVRTNEFKYGPIDGQAALDRVTQDLERQRQAMNNRGWMQSAADDVSEFFGSDDSELETYLSNTQKALRDLEERKGSLSEADYQAELQRILGGYGERYLHMSKDEAESAENWNLAEDITKGVVATGVGIVVTIGTGGNVVAGAAAGFGTYQLMEGADDVYVESKGGDSTADGHLSLIGLGAEAVQGEATLDQAKMAGVDAAVDAVSSFGVSKGVVLMGRTSTMLAARTLPGLATRLPGGLAARTGLSGLQIAARGAATPQLATVAAQNTAQSLGLRMVSTAGGLTVMQGVQSTAQMANSTIRLGADGNLSAADLTQLGKDAHSQGVYVASAPVAGLIVGRFAPTVGRQAAIDLGTNFVQEETRALVVDGRHMNGLEAYAATLGIAPGTLINIASQPGSFLNRRLQPQDEATIRNQIAERANQIWEDAGRPEGQANAHWRQAQDEILGLNDIINARAHQLWEEAGRPEGESARFWTQAENEVLFGLTETGNSQHNQIARRAHEIWEEAGRPEGQSDTHWRQAEQEIHQGRITERAYQIWENEGRPEGRHRQHWQQAEAEIRLEDDATYVIGATGEWRPADGLGALAPLSPRETSGGLPENIARIRPDGTPVQRTPGNLTPWGLQGIQAIIWDTALRSVDQSPVGNSAPRYGHYAKPGDLVDSVYGLPIHGAPEGSKIVLDVNGERVEATVVRVELPANVDEPQSLLTTRDQQPRHWDNGFLDENKGGVVETAWRLSRSGLAGQDRWNTPGRVVEGEEVNAGVRSAAGDDLAQVLASKPQRWTPALIKQVEDYLGMADRSFDPNLHDATDTTRTQLGGLRLPEAGAEFTPQHVRAIEELLGTDAMSFFTGSKQPGELSRNGARVLEVLGGQSRLLADLPPGELAARLDPAAPDGLTAPMLTSGGTAKWTKAGRQEIGDYLQQARRSTDPAVRQSAADAYALLKGRAILPGRPVTAEQAEAILSVFRADRQSKWISGIELSRDPTFKGRGALSPEGRTVRDVFELSNERWNPDLWREVKGYLNIQSKSPDADVRTLAGAVSRAMPDRMPRQGDEMNSEVLGLLPRLFAADAASAWRVPTRGVQWQSVYRPDRSTISQYLQDHWSVIALNKGLGFLPIGIGRNSSGNPLFSVNLPVPTRQAYMEWSEKNNGPKGTGFIGPVHPGDVEGGKVFPNGHRPNLVRDPNSPDPSRPWVLGAPMQVKLTAQTEIAAGIGLFGLNVGGIHRKIRYLGSHDGRPGYMWIEPMRLTNEQALFIETAFRGGVNHYHSGGKQVGPNGERLLFRNYETVPIWARSAEAWRRGIFAELPRETSAGPRRVLDRTDKGIYASFGVPHFGLASLEAGNVRKGLTTHGGYPRPHLQSSDLAQDAYAALEASHGRWTPETLDAMHAYLDEVALSPNAEYRAAGESVRQTLPDLTQGAPADLGGIRRRLELARLSLPHFPDSSMTRAARREQLREAKRLLRNQIPMVQAHALDQLLKQDVRLLEENRIRERAYQLWEAAGRPEGKADELWQQAALEIKGRPVHP